MRAIILTLLSSLVLTAPAAAEITDLRARLDGDAGQIWIAFDGQPTGVTGEVTESGLIITIDGVTVRTRTISPASDDLVAAVNVEPAGEGAIVRLFASRGWQGAQAELRRGGVLVSMTVTAPPAVHVPDSVYAAGASPAGSAGSEGSDAAPARRHVTEAHAAGAPDATMVVDHSASDAAGATGAPAVSPTPGPTDLFAASPAAQQVATGGSVAPPGVCVEQAQAVAASPWDDEMLHAQAACLGAAGHLAPAASIYEQMLAFEPENYRAAVALAEIRVAEGDTAAARDLFDQAASHAISDAEAARARSRLRALREP
ncbi:tetratricopeptide repeat protein [Maricaulis sp.]|uniref:tetratricopeptide repeat protein n=1 Tax=Maricaulis sp. TaxID=1486257 RepID=UPI002B26AAE7|nr:tetratricopeptide repeat protein [Maricaulis sp.]